MDYILLFIYCILFLFIFSSRLDRGDGGRRWDENEAWNINCEAPKWMRTTNANIVYTETNSANQREMSKREGGGKKATRRIAEVQEM